MTTYANAASVIGAQRPRLEWIPPDGRLSDAGQKAIDLAGMAGLHLDEWQQYVLDQALRRRWDGKWTAFETALIVSRQNGKGSLLEARELAGLFLGEQDGFGDERLILHSAHEFKTASEAFRRVNTLIQDTRLLSRHVKSVYLQRGAESIELKDGKRLRFIARTTGSGRGFTGDLVILDEAQKLTDDAMAALLPTLSARPNPQVWYTATAGDEQSIQLGRVRRRGIAGGDRALAFFEWSATEDDDPADPATWATANPGLGIRITEDYVARERAALGPDAFARERLGIGNYPADEAAWAVIPEATWRRLQEPGSAIPAGAPVAFAADATPNQSHGAIAAAAFRDDGRLHVEVVDHRADTAWIPARVAELAARWGVTEVVIDPKREASPHIGEIEKLGVTVRQPTPRDMTQACGGLYVAACDTGNLVHLGQPQLDTALSLAVRRELAGSWAWDAPRGVDLSPLVAVTLAAWAAAAGPQSFFGSWR